MDVVVTDFGTVRLAAATIDAMDRNFPGWRDPKAIKGRRKSQRLARERAQRGNALIVAAASTIGELAWVDGQNLIEL